MTDQTKLTDWILGLVFRWRRNCNSHSGPFEMHGALASSACARRARAKDTGQTNAKADSTLTSSQAVLHPSTNRALRPLNFGGRKRSGAFDAVWPSAMTMLGIAPGWSHLEKHGGPCRVGGRNSK
jgi:hypothetical protein